MSLLGAAVNIEDIYKASGAVGASVAGPTKTNEDCRGLIVNVKVTAKSGTNPTLVVKVQGYDIASTDWVDVPGAATVAFTDVGSKQLVLYPGQTVAANVSLSTPCPKTWRLYYTIGGTETPTVTFSVGYILIV